MTIFRFSNGHVVTPTGVLNDATIVVEDGRIARIGASDSQDSSATAIDLDGGWLMPGFVDTQVNGGGGVRFNDTPTV